MNFISAILLLFLDEEAVFWLLATFVEDLLPDYFTRFMLGSKARAGRAAAIIAHALSPHRPTCRCSRRSRGRSCRG
jgi:hypothetical protein